MRICPPSLLRRAWFSFRNVPIIAGRSPRILVLTNNRVIAHRLREPRTIRRFRFICRTQFIDVLPDDPRHMWDVLCVDPEYSPRVRIGLGLETDGVVDEPRDRSHLFETISRLATDGEEESQDSARQGQAQELDSPPRSRIQLLRSATNFQSSVRDLQHHTDDPIPESNSHSDASDPYISTPRLTVTEVKALRDKLAQTLCKTRRFDDLAEIYQKLNFPALMQELRDRHFRIEGWQNLLRRKPGKCALIALQGPPPQDREVFRTSLLLPTLHYPPSERKFRRFERELSDRVIRALRLYNKVDEIVSGGRRLFILNRGQPIVPQVRRLEDWEMEVLVKKHKTDRLLRKWIRSYPHL
jgi:hypothetical protein